MKNILTLILVLFILLGCDQKKEVKATNKENSDIKIEKPSAKSMVAIEAGTIKMEDISKLIPIDIINSKSTNVYKKYGLEFSGNCYACDLANLSIGEKTIKLVNVCDEKINLSFEILNISESNDRIEIKVKQTYLVFSKIDKAPVYELKINGNDLEAENLRISRYYTLSKILHKFEQHDCGDFQG